MRKTVSLSTAQRPVSKFMTEVASTELAPGCLVSDGWNEESFVISSKRCQCLVIDLPVLQPGHKEEREFLRSELNS